VNAVDDILSVVHVDGVCHRHIHATAPWGLQDSTEVSARFGLVSRGHLWLSVPGIAEPESLHEGDFFLLSPGQEYVMLDDPHTGPTHLAGALCEQQGTTIYVGGGGARTTIIAGRFTFDAPSSHAVTDLLPRLILIRAARSRALGLEKALELLAAESRSDSPGSRVVVQRLADLVLIQALRAHIGNSDELNTRLVHALSDAQIGAALRLMHNRTEHTWTVAALASEAGMSRSAFAHRFKELVGGTPLEYLTRWRMYRASSLLRESGHTVAEVAQSVGYDSDGAFHKAFKRVLGVGPGEYRRAAAFEANHVLSTSNGSA